MKSEAGVWKPVQRNVGVVIRNGRLDRAMAENSAIEWTDATWNPVTGCTKISAGCDNCYAARFSERFRGVPGHPFEPGFDLTLRPRAVEAAGGVEASPHDLRQLDERPLPQGHPTRAYRRGVRRNGAGRLARLPSSHQAKLADAEVRKRPLRRPNCSPTYLVRRIR